MLPLSAAATYSSQHVPVVRSSTNLTGALVYAGAAFFAAFSALAFFILSAISFWMSSERSSTKWTGTSWASSASYLFLSLAYLAFIDSSCISSLASLASWASSASCLFFSLAYLAFRDSLCISYLAFSPAVAAFAVSAAFFAAFLAALSALAFFMRSWINF